MALGHIDVIGEVVMKIVLQRQRLVISRSHPGRKSFSDLAGKRAVVVWEIEVPIIDNLVAAGSELAQGLTREPWDLGGHGV